MAATQRQPDLADTENNERAWSLAPEVTQRKTIHAELPIEP